MKFTRIFLLLSLMVLSSGEVICAQRPDREQWMDQINQYRRSYFTKELDLSPQQSTKFFELYDEMTDKTSKIDAEARTMERRVAEAKDATDLEYEKATEALYDAKVQEAQIEKEYMLKFKDILTRKQLFNLQTVEKNFTREMMRQHNRLKQNRAKK